MNGQRAGADHPTFGDIHDGDLPSELVDVLRDEDPCRFLATDLDEQPRIDGLDSLAAVALWRKAEHYLADYLGLEPRDDVLSALDEREQEIQVSHDVDAAIAHVEEVRNEAELQTLLTQEVEREQPRKPVVGAINVRQQELRQAAATDGGEEQ